MDIYLHKNGLQAGPFSEPAVRAGIVAGEYNVDDLAWVEGEATWQPLSSIVNLALPSPVPVVVSQVAKTGADSTEFYPSAEKQSFWERDMLSWKGGRWIYIFCGWLCFLSIPVWIVAPLRIASEIGLDHLRLLILGALPMGVTALYGGVVLIRKGKKRIANPELFNLPVLIPTPLERKKAKEKKLMWGAAAALIPLLFQAYEHFHPEETHGPIDMFGSGSTKESEPRPQTPKEKVQFTTDQLASPESLHWESEHQPGLKLPKPRRIDTSNETY